MRTTLRSILALLAAALAPAGLFLVPMGAALLKGDGYDAAAWSGFSRWLVIVMGTSLLYVVFLGVPVFLLLRWRRAIRWWSATAAGFVVAGLPIAYSLWPHQYADMQTTASHWNGERMVHTMIDGVPTQEGWLEYGAAIASFGLLGAIGGFAGWLVWRVLRPRGER